jgi:hypothetical protein
MITVEFQSLSGSRMGILDLKSGITVYDAVNTWRRSKNITLQYAVLCCNATHLNPLDIICDMYVILILVDITDKSIRTCFNLRYIIPWKIRYLEKELIKNPRNFELIVKSGYVEMARKIYEYNYSLNKYVYFPCKTPYCIDIFKALNIIPHPKHIVMAIKYGNLEFVSWFINSARFVAEYISKKYYYDIDWYIKVERFDLIKSGRAVLSYPFNFNTDYYNNSFILSLIKYSEKYKNSKSVQNISEYAKEVMLFCYDHGGLEYKRHYVCIKYIIRCFRHNRCYEFVNWCKVWYCTTVKNNR